MLVHITSFVTLPSLISGYDIDFQILVITWIIIMGSVAMLCFTVSEITGNYSQVDKLWSLIPVLYSWITAASFPSVRIYIMASLVTIWGFRLSYNFYRKSGYNVIPWKGTEDYRWTVMRERPELRGRIRFGLFNLVFISFYQNILILLFSTPLLMAAFFQEKPLTVADFFAAAIMLLFIIIEGVADTQLFRFQQQKKKTIPEDGSFMESLRRGFMTEGLWKYVRHPNFVSEQAIWISFYFFGVAASGKLINLTIAGPVLLVLLFIGSTQLTEGISRGKYPDYERYQREVPKILPRLFR